MDWYSWLSKSRLDPSLAYDYSLLFTHNELEQEDIAHFNHEFLQSMGISIAKHRLEILKLAKKFRKRPPQPVATLLAAVSKTKKCFSKYIHSLIARRGDSTTSAIVVVQKPMRSGGGGRWRGVMLRRNKKGLVVMNGGGSKQGKLMITDGTGGPRVKKVGGNSPLSHSASPMVFRCGGGNEGGEDEYWGGRMEEDIRWDSMFQDLKPT